MKKYDDWKLHTPENDEQENECAYCGEPCDRTYCSSECKKAYESEN